MATPKVAPTTSSLVGGALVINAITSAYSSYEAGRMQEVAYHHKAVMDEINAKQIGIDAQFVMADEMDKLAKSLSIQNVIGAASGISGGSAENVTGSFLQDYKNKENRMKVTGNSKRIARMMDSKINRAAGKSAAKTGMMSGFIDLTSKGANAARYLV